MCAGGLPVNAKKALPRVQVRIDSKTHWALVDTGCSQSIVTTELVANARANKGVLTIDGRVVQNVKVSCSLGSQWRAVSHNMLGNARFSGWI